MCEVPAENGTLLNVSDRTFQIPRGKGFPGQSNVWYGNDTIQKLFSLKEIYVLISMHKVIQRDIPKKWRQDGKPNKKEILAIERAAIKKAWEHYEKTRL